MRLFNSVFQWSVTYLTHMQKNKTKSNLVTRVFPALGANYIRQDCVKASCAMFARYCIWLKFPFIVLLRAGFN